MKSMAVCCVLLSVLVVIFQPLAYAEGGSCPDGYFPVGGGGVQGCAPIPTSDGGYPRDPGPQWAKRWGAIAVDIDLARFGGAQGFPSKAKAQRAATKECKKNGGKRCGVYSYYNQCGALAWGDSYVYRSRGPIQEDVIADAVSKCSTKTTNCKSYYAGCSYPEQVR